MDELNELRVAARNRLLCCIGGVVALGIAAVAATRQPFLLFFFLVPGIIVSALLMKKPRQRYRAAFKQAYVRRALQSVFTDLYYDPERGISYDTIAATRMMNMGDRFRSEDYISGRYKDIPFEQSDVHIEEERQSTDSEGHTTTEYVTIFRGRWMIFDFNKEFKANVQIAQKGFPNAKRKRFFGKKEELFKPVEMESEIFNKQFRVFAQNEHDAFYIITPSFMERVQSLTARNKGKLLFCFVGNRLHIAIHDNKDSFEPGSIFKRPDEEKLTQKLRVEIGVITQFIDELSLDNNLFKQSQQSPAEIGGGLPWIN